MRPAVQKIIELYSTSPVFQDLVETAAMTGITATGQAIATDMSPEEIALSSLVGAGAAMVGRPALGRAGQAIGGVIDRNSPQTGVILKQAIENTKQMPGIGPVMAAKMGPYKDLDGAAQYGQLLGRAYGDNIAQLAVAGLAPMVFAGEDDA